MLLSDLTLAIGGNEFNVALGVVCRASTGGDDSEIEPFTTCEGVEDALTIGSWLSR